jgi:hypothetical protein
VVAARRKAKLAPYDKLLRRFRYRWGGRGGGAVVGGGGIFVQLKGLRDLRRVYGWRLNHAGCMEMVGPFEEGTRCSAGHVSCRG